MSNASSQSDNHWAAPIAALVISAVIALAAGLLTGWP
jgi:hypothetical protein